MSQKINIDVTPGKMMPMLYYSQGDVGRTFQIAIVSSDGYELPTGATVTLQATKPSGFGFSVEADSVTNGVATFTTTATMTDEYGRFPAEIQITDGDDVIYSANFIMVGEKNPHPDGTIDGSEGSIVPELTLLVERVEAAAESIHDLTVSATTLAAGSNATATYDDATNNITFGIPKGADGTVTEEQLDAAVSDLKSDLDNISEFERIAPNTTASSYRLKTDGNAAANNSYNFLKYYVSEGQKIYVVSKLGTQDNDRGFQFQDRDSVATSNNESHVVGTPSDADFNGYVTVPSGACMLCISVLKTDTESGVYSVLDGIAEQTDYAENNIGFVSDKVGMLTNSTRVEPTSVSDGYALNSNGVSETNASMRILKYAVVGGTKVNIFARQYVNAVYQFQTNASVGGRTEKPTRRVGDTITTATAEEVTVPSGATYLIINDILDGDNGVYTIESSAETDDVRINPNLCLVNLIAHKGGSYGYDGSINRLKYSYEHGYKILEMDVQFTSDGVPVIHHDSSISSGGETITIASTAYADLITYDLGDGSHIMSLDEAVLFCKKRGLALEIDMSNATLNATKAKTITDVVIDRGMLGSAIFTGVPSKQALITAITNKAILSVSNLYDETTTETIDSVAEYKAVASAVICSINHSKATETLVNYAHEKGLIVKTWTHANATTVNADLAIGADLAICDNIYPDTFEITD